MCKRLFDIKLQQVLSVEMALHRGSFMMSHICPIKAEPMASVHYLHN